MGPYCGGVICLGVHDEVGLVQLDLAECAFILAFNAPGRYSTQVARSRANVERDRVGLVVLDAAGPPHHPARLHA